MLETMARFRPAPAAEALLAAVIGVEANEVDHADPLDGVRDWLSLQRVGRVRLAEPGQLLDVHDTALLRDLDKHPLVRTAPETSGLGTPLPARLDEGLVRLGGLLGRPVTQARSRAVREWLPQVRRAGLPITARRRRMVLGNWDDTPVDVRTEPLDAPHRHHRRRAVRAAQILEISLPPEWH